MVNSKTYLNLEVYVGSQPERPYYVQDTYLSAVVLRVVDPHRNSKRIYLNSKLTFFGNY